MKKEISLALNKEMKENLVARNCELTAGVLTASFKTIEDDNERDSLRFINIEGEINITEVDNYILLTDLETLNNAIIHKDLIFSFRVFLK